MNNAQGTPLASGTRPKLLLVEDDPAVRRSLQLLLQARGFDVRSYAAGASLLADANALDAACFITDYRIDDLDGLALLRSLRDRGWTGPAILITAFPSPQLAAQAEAVGFQAVIDKPFREHLISDTVLQAIAAATA
ncbi:response regulator [Flavisphingomonas formosensis]|uniref:response regulator n=1 Tax=Flavisphingomonas formosensis TaxID=861534 RepID=UPI0012F92C06|nr:response regulator [Sphingomonas formosensis]